MTQELRGAVARFARDEHGAATAEYGILIVVIAMVAIAAVTTVAVVGVTTGETSFGRLIKVLEPKSHPQICNLPNCVPR